MANAAPATDTTLPVAGETAAGTSPLDFNVGEICTDSNLSGTCASISVNAIPSCTGVVLTAGGTDSDLGAEFATSHVVTTFLLPEISASLNPYLLHDSCPGSAQTKHWRQFLQLWESSHGLVKPILVTIGRFFLQTSRVLGGAELGQDSY
ncbi:hypothetical protein C8J56DRAFT_1085114 [Mycena floridula]|nr:hypothetical protein C8J56DRAFT_1085114 [Mycena floridula]